MEGSASEEGWAQAGGKLGSEAPSQQEGPGKGRDAAPTFALAPPPARLRCPVPTSKALKSGLRSGASRTTEEGAPGPRGRPLLYSNPVQAQGGGGPVSSIFQMEAQR